LFLLFAGVGAARMEKREESDRDCSQILFTSLRRIHTSKGLRNGETWVGCGGAELEPGGEIVSPNPPKSVLSLEVHLFFLLWQDRERLVTMHVNILLRL
jgi:hypothetical protein